MKTLKIAALSLSLVMAMTSGAFAATSTQRAASVCKTEAGEQYGAEGQSVRVKFKMATGSRQAPQILLKVIPKGADSFEAVCGLDSKSAKVLYLNRI